MPKVLHRRIDPPIKHLPVSARTTLKKADKAGWESHTLRSLVFVETTYLATDASTVKKRAHVARHVWLRSRHPKHPIGFVAHWQDGKFDEARVIDPYGQPVELYVDYEPAKRELARKAEEPEWAWERRVLRMKSEAAQREADYNDGASHLVKDYIFAQKGGFDSWFSTWIELMSKAEETAK